MSPSRRSGITLILAGVAVLVLASPLLLGAPGSAGFFSVPLLSGLGFLLAAVAGGRRSPLWGTGITVSVWGALVLLHFYGLLLPGVADRTVYASAIAVGAIVALLVMPLLRLRIAWVGTILAVVISLGLYLAALAGVPVVDQWWLYAAILAARGLVELVRPAGPRSDSSRRLAKARTSAR